MNSNNQYQTWYYLRGFRIEETLIQRANEKSVWLVRQALFEGEPDTFARVGRTSYWGTYFPTLEEAVARQKEDATKKRDAAKKNFDEAEKVLASIEAGEVPVRKLEQHVQVKKGQKIVI